MLTFGMLACPIFAMPGVHAETGFGPGPWERGGEGERGGGEGVEVEEREMEKYLGK